MREPDDDQLNALLRQWHSSMPRPSQEFEARVLRAYERRFPSRAGWRRFFSLRFAVPLPIAAVPVLALLALGLAMGANSRFSATQTETAEKGPRIPKSRPIDVDLTNQQERLLGGLQVVAELRPKLIGGGNESR